MFLVLEHVPSANSAKAGDGTGSRPVTPLGRRACRADGKAGEWVQVCSRVPVVVFPDRKFVDSFPLYQFSEEESS